MFTVMIRKRAIKSIEKMPKSVQAVFRDLVKDLELKGPVQPEWANYSKLSIIVIYHIDGSLAGDMRKIQ